MGPLTPDLPRVLVMAPVFAPASPIGTMRPLRLVRRMEADGWRATVLTATPATYLPSMPQDPALLDRVPRGVELIHAPVLRPIESLSKMLRPERRRPGASNGARPSGVGPQRGSWYRRLYTLFDELTSIPDREIGWVLPAIWQGMAIVRKRRPVAIYSTAPPWSAQVAAYGVATLSGLPWVADFRDPWARAPWRENQPERQRRAAVRLEARVIERADAVLFATPANRQEYAAHYGSLAAKFHVISNGCDPDEFIGLEHRSNKDVFTLLHAGSLYGARTPIPLFKAIASAISKGLLHRHAFKLRLIGTATLDHELNQTIFELDLHDIVECIPRMPRQRILAEMASASGLLVLQPATTVSVPGKLYEYLAMTKPVFGLCEEGDTADLVRSSGTGVAVTSMHVDAIEAGLLEFLRFAERPLAPARPDLYDGNRFAGEALAIIAAVSRQGSGRSDSASARAGASAVAADQGEG